MADQAFSEMAAALDELVSAVQASDVKKMKEIGNRLTSHVVLSQDREELNLAMIAYMLNKIFQKEHYRRESQNWNEFVVGLRNALRDGKTAAEQANRIQLSSSISIIIDQIKALDAEFGRFAVDILEKAMAHKGSTLYALGLSLGQAAELTGSTEWEILRETGKTKVADEEKPTKNLEDRFRFAKKVLS